MDGAALRIRIGRDEFDYQALGIALGEYANRRNKVSRLLRGNVITRVKKGLYAFSDPYRRSPLCRELFANLIYGPSYVSLEYALQFHGLIPEGVLTVTSVTTGRPRSFSTPIGVFSYRQIPAAAFSPGMDRMELEDGRAFLIATPEKALADKVALDRSSVRSMVAMRRYLLEDLRLDEAAMRELEPGRLKSITEAWPSERLRLLTGVVEDAHAAQGSGE